MDYIATLSNLKQPYGTLRNRSFTLIELIMVMAVIAIIAVVVSISPGPNKLIGVTNKLMFDLRYAQQLAISRQVNCGLSFNPSGNSYFVYIGNTSTIAADPHTAGELSIDFDTGSEYSGVSLSGTNFGDRIYFDSLGAPYNNTNTLLASQGVITLADGAYTKTVTIEPNTGEVKIP